MEDILSESIIKLRDIAEEVTRSVIAPKSMQVDRDAAWPEHSMKALADAGLLGLHVPRRTGGHEQGLLALAVLGETIARGCGSSSLCYSMHCVGTAVISAKATPYLEDRYLAPIAENKHITSLALSEMGTGAHFYLPQTKLERTDDDFIVNGVKQFVTNGSYADSYVISTKASTGDAEVGDFNCLMIDKDTRGITWLDPWRGFGMRGNSSRAMRIENAELPIANLLGEEGDQIWYIFEVVAPYFLIAMAGTYVGLAQAALDITLNHLQNRRYQHSGEILANIHVLQRRVAEMHMNVQKTRSLLWRAAYLGDISDPNAMIEIMSAKADAADLAVRVTNDAMTCCGGSAYRENSELTRLLRDARAGHVMSPTTDLLKSWSGRLLLGLPLFD